MTKESPFLVEAMIFFGLLCGLFFGVDMLSTNMKAASGFFMSLAYVSCFYGPLIFLQTKQRSLKEYGYTWQPIGKSIGLFLGITVLTLLPLILLQKFVVVYQFNGHLQFQFGAHPMGYVVPSLSIVLINSLLIAPAEEGAFRGFLYSSLRKRLSAHSTILLTSLGFALVHLMTQGHWTRLLVFFPALIFGWLREKSGSILPSILFHATCNVFALVTHMGSL